MKDPKYLGIPNINFSLTKKNDKREEEFAKQRIERGFDDSETWSLSGTIASFILPRLKRFKELDGDFTVRDKEWQDNLNAFERMLELEVRDNGSRIWTEEEENEINKGLEAFKEVFFGLWW